LEPPSGADALAHQFFLAEQARLRIVNLELLQQSKVRLNSAAAEFIPSAAARSGVHAWKCWYWLIPGESPATTQPPSDDESLKSGDVVSVSDSDSEDRLEVCCDAEATLLLRHLPRLLTTQSLMDAMNAEGFQGDYDFCYAPARFESGESLGYAFVNCVSDDAAQRLSTHFAGFISWVGVDERDSMLPCEVEHATGTQGRLANVERYRNSPVMHASVPEDLKPKLLSKGQVVAFPAPTNAIKAPRVRVRMA